MKKQEVRWDCYAWLSDPALSKCSPMVRGIWMDLLCAMHLDSSPSITGNPAVLSRLSRSTLEEMQEALDELESTGTAEVLRHDNGEVTLTSRRLKKGLKAREKGANRQREYRERHSSNANVTPIVTGLSQEKNNYVTKKGGYRGDKEGLKEKGDARGKNQSREMKNAEVTLLSLDPGADDPVYRLALQDPSLPPAALAYISITGFNPGRFLIDKIGAFVGDLDTNVLLFEAVVRAWKGKGWNYRQVVNLLDDFQKQLAKIQSMNQSYIFSKPANAPKARPVTDEADLDEDPDEAKRIRETIREGKIASLINNLDYNDSAQGTD